MKSGLKVFAPYRVYLVLGVATYAAMKSGLKGFYADRIIFPINGSNLCRDEKRTESSWAVVDADNCACVATYAAMKSGLKVSIATALKASKSVATYAAMKSGLKGLLVNASNILK